MESMVPAWRWVSLDSVVMCDLAELVMHGAKSDYLICIKHIASSVDAGARPFPYLVAGTLRPYEKMEVVGAAWPGLFCCDISKTLRFEMGV